VILFPHMRPERKGVVTGEEVERDNELEWSPYCRLPISDCQFPRFSHRRRRIQWIRTQSLDLWPLWICGL